MDSLTHITVGACAGEALLGKKLGKKAMLLGAIGHSLPDIDFITVIWSDTVSSLMAHRGFTHSILFDLLTMVLLSLLSMRFFRKHQVSPRNWFLFYGSLLTLHLFLDLYNNYGIGLLIPFSNERFSFQAIFVADPLFTIWPLIAFAVLLFIQNKDRRRRFWWKFGLTGALIYLVVCSGIKLLIDQDVKSGLTAGQSYQEVLTTPAPLNNLLWFVAVKQDSGFLVGYRSVFDSSPFTDLHYFPQNNHLLIKAPDQEELQKLIRFSQGYYTLEQWNDTLVFNDLRFGQVVGWYDPYEKFAFHYFLGFDDASNRLVVQRGRFARWNRETVQALWQRMKGN